MTILPTVLFTAEQTRELIALPLRLAPGAELMQRAGQAAFDALVALAQRVSPYCVAAATTAAMAMWSRRWLTGPDCNPRFFIPARRIRSAGMR